MADESQPAVEQPAAPAAPAAAPEAPAANDAPAPEGSETKAEAEARVYTQEEVDRIAAKIKKNERYRTKKEVEAYYQGRESAQPKPAEKPAAAAPADDKPPSREQYDTYEAFLDAKAEYTGRKAAHEYRVKAEAEAKAEAQARAAEERVQSFRSKLVEKYPDIAERAEAIGHVNMPSGMSEAIAESDFGPDIINHFVDNPKDFERIAALSPSAAIREVGKLEARLEGAAQKPAPTPEAKTPSKAPAPLKPVGGTAVIGDSEPSHDKPDEWRAWRDRQVMKRRAGAAK